MTELRDIGGPTAIGGSSPEAVRASSLPLMGDLSIQDYALRAYGVLQKHWLVVSLAFLFIILAGAIFTATQERLYTATAKILIHPRTPRILDGVKSVDQDAVGRGNQSLDAYYNTQHDIIAGSAVARLVVDRLALDRDLDFLDLPGDGATEASDSPERRIARAVALLQAGTVVRPSARSMVFSITATDRDPNRAADLANALATAYRDYTISLRVDLSSRSADWLKEQVEKQRSQVRTAEQAVQEFVTLHGLQSLSISVWQNLNAEKVARMTESLVDTEEERLQAEAVAESLESWIVEGQELSGHPAALGNDVLPKLSEQILELDRKLARDTEDFGPKYPGQASARSELTLLRNAYKAEVDKLAAGVRSALTVAQARETKLKGIIDVTRSKALDLGALEVEFNRLKRVAKSHAKLYEDTLRRAKETELVRNLEASNVNFLEPATVSRVPSHPNILLNAMMTLLVACFFGLGVAFLLDSLDGSIRDLEELDVYFRVQPLGILPSLNANKGRFLVVDQSPHSAPSECLRSIRTNLLFAAGQTDLRSLVVTSASPRDGKTMVCTNTAAAMAQAGHRVVVVDADLRRPHVHDVFGMDNSVGLVDVLIGQSTLEQAIRPSGVDGLFVLASGGAPSQPAEMLSSKGFGRLLERLNQSFDYIFLDSPPVLAVTDAAVLSQMVDGVVLVLRVGRTNRSLFRETLRTLDAVGSRVAGVVCNGVDLSARRYGYRYGYGYSYGYGYGYGYQYGRYRKRRAAGRDGGRRKADESSGAAS